MTRSTALKGRKKKTSGISGTQEFFNKCVAADILDTNEDVAAVKKRVLQLEVVFLVLVFVVVFWAVI